MSLSRGAEGSRWVMSIGAPRVTSNEYMWRIHRNLRTTTQSSPALPMAFTHISPINSLELLRKPWRYSVVVITWDSDYLFPKPRFEPW